MSDELMKQLIHELKYLGNGNASTHMGAIEGLSVMVKEGLLEVARALDNVAEALREAK